MSAPRQRTSLRGLPRKVSDSDFHSGREVPHRRVDSHEGVEALYDIGRQLGKGSYGLVYLASDRATGVQYALKVIDKQKAGSTGTRMLDNEVGVQKKISHEHIVELKEVLETSKRTYLVLELCEGGHLEHRDSPRSRFKEREVADLTRCIAQALVYLHHNDIAHRDLKPENVLLARPDDPLSVKLSDFGLCAMKQHERQMEMVCGTPVYMAPEVLLDRGAYSPLCDIWSTGVMMYFLLSGAYPFPPDDAGYPNHKKGLHFPGLRWRQVDPAAKELLERMLTVDPARRITGKEILLHPWITGLEGDCSNDNVLDMMKESLRLDHAANQAAQPASQRSSQPSSSSGSPEKHPDRRISRNGSQHSIDGGPATPTKRPVTKKAPTRPGYMNPTRASQESARVPMRATAKGSTARKTVFVVTGASGGSPHVKPKPKGKPCS